MLTSNARIVTKFSVLLTVFGLVLAANGCYQVKQDFTLNPDGSGKVDVEATFAPMMAQGNPDNVARGAVRDLLSKSEGIDVWTNVSFSATDDSRVFFKGTAYFKDLSKYRLSNFDDVGMRLFMNDQNRLELRLENKDEAKQSTTKPVDLSEEELAVKVKQQKTQYQQTRLMMATFLSGMKTDLSFTLPGKVKQSTNFKINKKGKLNIVFEGDEMLAGLDELASDEEWWKERILSGSDIDKGPPPGPKLYKKLFGEEAPISAILKSKTKTLFDYEQEVAEAKKNYENMLTELDLADVIPVPMEAGGSFESIRIVRVSLSFLEDPDYTLFGNEKNYRITLIGKLPGSVLKVDGGKIETAIADNGQSLLPESDWDRDIRFPSLSQDKTAVMFDVTLTYPDEEVKFIELLSGTLYYLVAGESNETDLGISEFKTGSKGTALGATIETIEESSWQAGQYEMTIAFNVPASSIKSVKFFDESGKKMEVASAGYYDNSNFGSSFKYSLEHPFPEKGSIKAEAYGDLKKFEITFEVERVNLLGRPID